MKEKVHKFLNLPPFYFSNLNYLRHFFLNSVIKYAFCLDAMWRDTGRHTVTQLKLSIEK